MRLTTLLFVVMIALGGAASVTPAQQPASSADQPRKCVAVLGAVQMPGYFELKQRTRLLEVVALAGGFKDAGPTISVISSGNDCPEDRKPTVTKFTVPSQAPAATDSMARFYRIADIITTDENKNPYVEPGDMVVVNEVEQAYVVGAVMRPLAIALRKPITLTEAVTMAGGLVRDARTDNVRIIRQSTTSDSNIELKVDLNKIRKKRAEDVILQPNDIVEVRFKHGRIGDRGGVFPIYDTPVRGVIY